MNTDKLEREILLGESQPVTVTEPISKFWKRFGFKDRVYTIEKKPLPYGVVLQITSCLAEINVPDLTTVKDYAKFLNDNANYVTKTIAYALNCKSDKTIPDRLLKYIRRNMDAVEATEIFYFIIEQTKIVNFTTAIRLILQTLIATEQEEVKEKSEVQPK